MSKRGYKPAIEESEELRKTVSDLDAYFDLGAELLQRINGAAGGRRVTRAELKRDFGFTNSALRLLEKSRQLRAAGYSGTRPIYDLTKALRIRVLQAGVVAARHVKTKRKHSNITTVYREYLDRITEAPPEQNGGARHEAA